MTAVADVHVSEQPILILGSGPAGTGSLEIRITPSYAADIVSLLDDRNISYSDVLEHSAGSDLVVYAIYGGAALGGLSGLAAVLNAFFHKHAGARWKVKVGDIDVSAEGCSLKQAERWVRHALEQYAELERRWAAVRERDAVQRAPDNNEEKGPAS